MVGVKLFTFLLFGAAASLAVEAMEWDTFAEFNAAKWTAERAAETKFLNQKRLPTLAEYIEAKKKRVARHASARAFVQTPFIDTVYTSNGDAATPTSLGCPKASVGVHAFRTSAGVEYRRHEFVELGCLDEATGTDLGQDNLFECAEAAATGNYNSFTFSEGMCTGYPIWRHRKLTTCSSDPAYEGDLAEAYIATEILTDYDAVSRYPVQLEASIHGVGRLTLEWTADDECSAVAKYVISSVTGTEERVGGKGDYYYHTFNEALCDDSAPEADKTISVTAYDFDGAEILLFQSTAVTTGSVRTLLSDGSCVMYDPAVALDYDGAVSYCEGFSATLPTESLVLSFDEYQQMISTVSGPVEDHFTNAIVTEDLEWQWSDLCSPVADSEWDSGTSPDNFTIGTCSTSSSADDYALLQEDCADSQAVVCYDAPYRVVDYEPYGIN